LLGIQNLCSIFGGRSHVSNLIVASLMWTNLSFCLVLAFYMYCYQQYAKLAPTC